MTRRVLGSLLVLLALAGCTRPPTPVPIQVSTTVPERLVPVRVAVAGQVLDAATRQPVAGVQVQGLHYSSRYNQSVQAAQASGGTFSVLTDAQGRFAYNAAVARHDTSRFLLFVDALEFAGRAWCSVAPAQQTTILLHPRPPILLPPDSCHTSAEARLLNPRTSRWNIRSPFTAWYIDNARSQAETTLRSVALRGAPVAGLMERGPLYFQLFAVNPATGGPGEAIFTQEAYVSFPEPGRVATYDLTPYQIAIPPGGFYLVMAPVLSGNMFRALTELEHYRPTGRLLQAPCAFTDARSWTYQQGHWQPTPRAQNTWPLFERLITLEVGSVAGPVR